MDVTLNLNAYVIGLGEASFPVRAESSSQIGVLKEEILPKIPRRPPGLVAAELTLYHVALTATDDALKTLKLEDYRDKTKLNARDLVFEIFPNQPSLKDVSILVELPSIALYKQHPRRASIPMGLSPEIVRRDELIEYLFNLAEDKRFVQVRGSPASGKTILLHLLHAYAVDQKGVKAFRIDNWKKLEGNTADDKLHGVTGSWPNASVPTYLLLDEGQATYSDGGLWNIFKTLSDTPYHRAVVFCSYGSAGVRASPQPPTPDHIEDSQRLTLRPENHPHGLLLTLAEFYDMVAKRNDPPLTLSLEVKTKIFEWTAGHVGAIDFFLKSIRTQHKTSQYQGNAYTLEDFYPKHAIQQVAPDFIGSSAGRGLPIDSDLQNREVSQVFRDLLKCGSLSQYPDGHPLREKMSLCHENGWIYSTISGDKKEVYEFASPLHMSVISWVLEAPEEDITQSTLLELTIAVVARFKPSQLAMPIRRARFQKAAHTPPEAQYQDEFYRALHDLTRGAVRISPEFASGYGADQLGRIDFFLAKKKWGIELTRDGKLLAEHAERFASGGAYGQWVSSGEMMEYILLDCRQSKPRAKHRSKFIVLIDSCISLIIYDLDIPHLYHAVFQGNPLTTVKILDNDLKELEECNLSEHRRLIYHPGSSFM